MSIIWTLTGLVLTGIITGAITSSLTTLTVPPDVKLYGTKVSDFLTVPHYITAKYQTVCLHLLFGLQKRDTVVDLCH